MKDIEAKSSETACKFCQIIHHQENEHILYDDEVLVVFPDHQPRAPVHLLIVPRIHLGTFLDLNNTKTMVAILQVAQKFIRELELDQHEYTLGFHGGRNQSIKHVHAQLLGKMGDKLVL